MNKCSFCSCVIPHFRGSSRVCNTIHIACIKNQQQVTNVYLAFNPKLLTVVSVQYPELLSTHHPLQTRVTIFEWPPEGLEDRDTFRHDVLDGSVLQDIIGLTWHVLCGLQDIIGLTLCGLQDIISLTLRGLQDIVGLTLHVFCGFGKPLRSPSPGNILL